MSRYDKTVIALKHEDVLKEEADPVHNYAQGIWGTRDKVITQGS